MFLPSQPRGFPSGLPLVLSLNMGFFTVGASVRAEPPLAKTEAEQHLRTAEKAIQRRDFVRAREELAKCLRLGPDNVK